MMHAWPVAVLVPKDGEPIVVPIQNPPPPDFLLAVTRPVIAGLAEIEMAPTREIERRRFVLEETMRTRDHQWLRTYNEGRSCTPEDAFVYFEDVS